jgi:hypothetical protein
MRSLIILLFILGSMVTAYAQKSSPVPVITRFYHFTGTIDKYPVTFYLYRINDKFNGSYYYNSTEEAIEINGELDKNRTLKLSAFDREGKKTEAFSGPFKDSSFSGTWSYKGKSLSFRISQQNDNSGLTFDYIYTTGSKKLKGDQNNRSELSYEAETVWPAATANHAATNLVKQVIYEAFGEKEGKEAIGKVMVREKNDLLNQSNNPEEITTYAAITTIQVTYRSAQLLSLAEFSYNDGGGVHGNYGTSYTCIDLVHNRTMAIMDVMDTTACREIVKSLLVKKFRSSYQLKNDENLTDYLFENDIPITENFYLTSKGIGFNYNPYEIGAYALGSVSLYIPFSELGPCLNPEFKRLVGL